MRWRFLSVVALTAGLAACGGGSSSSSSTLCDYYDVEGCAVFGLVLTEPVSTADALAIASDLQAVPIAVWRTDFTCVKGASAGLPGPLPEARSRFAYVNADQIRDRHLDASGSVAPPITGLHIFESYWGKYVDEWTQVQQSGVLLEAIAVYLPDDSAGSLAADPRFREVVTFGDYAWRTESLSPSYTGELVIDGFPSGYLSTPAGLSCG